MRVTRYPLVGKAALFGGTFDPPHTGHRAIGELARGLLNADEWCVVMPTSKNPLKETGALSAPAADRVAMVNLLFDERGGYQVSRFEIDRPAPAYTIDTVRALLQENPQLHTLYLILGQDSVANISRWREHQLLLELIVPVVIARGGITEIDPALSPAIRKRFTRFLALHSPASSTALRQQLAAAPRCDSQAGSCVEGLPDPIHSYILQHGLYRPAER